MTLADWRKNGWLLEHRTSTQEIADLLAIVERDLADSAADQLSADWRMNIAYNAGLQAATAALAAAGYRASRDQHHFRVIPVADGDDRCECATHHYLRRLPEEAKHHGL